MGAGIQVEVVAPMALDAVAQDAWRRIRAADPGFESPYFDLRYILAAGAVAPGARIAVIRRGGEIEGFLPFQRRGGLIQPLGAPLTDYHGLVTTAEANLDLADVVAALGARRFRFESLVALAPVAGGQEERRAMVADLSAGFEAYAAARPTGFLKDKRRRARRLAEDHGELTFSFGPARADELDHILRLKRDQMRRTAQHDIFATAWTGNLLRALAARPDADFGLRFAVLRAGGKIVAAEAGLLSGTAYHLWLPVYDPAFAKYSPGVLATLETMNALADAGVRTVDFGSGGEAYKHEMAAPGQVVLAGQLAADPRTWRIFGAALARAPRLRRTLRSAVGRLDRRWDRITACEPSLEGRSVATARTLGRLSRRHPKTSIGVGLGFGASLGLLGLLAD